MKMETRNIESAAWHLIGQKTGGKLLDNETAANIGAALADSLPIESNEMCKNASLVAIAILYTKSKKCREVIKGRIETNAQLLPALSIRHIVRSFYSTPEDVTEITLKRDQSVIIPLLFFEDDIKPDRQQRLERQVYFEIWNDDKDGNFVKNGEFLNGVIIDFDSSFEDEVQDVAGTKLAPLKQSFEELEQTMKRLIESDCPIDSKATQEFKLSTPIYKQAAVSVLSRSDDMLDPVEASDRKLNRQLFCLIKLAQEDATAVVKKSKSKIVCYKIEPVQKTEAKQETTTTDDES
jgi:hypothetical protein